MIEDISLRDRIRQYALEDEMAKAPTALEQVNKLQEDMDKIREDMDKLRDQAKAEALARAEEIIDTLTALGFNYQIVNAAAPSKKPAKKQRAAPTGNCPICERQTVPPHDGRAHRGGKPAFTDADIQERGWHWA